MKKADRFATAARAGARLEGAFVVDVHAHMGEYNVFHMVRTDAASMIRVMDRVGIDVTMPASHHACLGADVRRGNDEVLQAMRDYPGRFLGYACLNPNYRDEIVPELERCLDAGMPGIKIHSGMGAYDLDNYRLAFDLARERGVPILAHAYPGDLAPLEKLAEKYPMVQWILGHAGTLERTRYIELAKRLPNLWLEPTASLSPRGVPDCFIEAGLGDRLMWGSDCPFLSATQQIGRVLLARMSADWKRKVLGETARRLFPAVERLAAAR
ncbi:MAG TPA: amidohydrolase family protein [Candidatus Brocadiia bacterium]|nr:amidohydrolase family protein [Candidatus Brocadiia bacterium]